MTIFIIHLAVKTDLDGGIEIMVAVSYFEDFKFRWAKVVINRGQNIGASSK